MRGGGATRARDGHDSQGPFSADREPNKKAIDEIGWTPYHLKLFFLNGFGSVESNAFFVSVHLDGNLPPLSSAFVGLLALSVAMPSIP